MKSPAYSQLIFELTNKRTGNRQGLRTDLGDHAGRQLLPAKARIKPWRFWEWRQMIFHSDRFKNPNLITRNLRAVVRVFERVVDLKQPVPGAAVL